MNSLTRIYPEQLLEEFSIGKDTYYTDLKFLGIVTKRDKDRKTYLTEEDAEKFRQLRTYITNTGTRKWFESSKNWELTVSEPNQIATQQNAIEYPQPEEPIADDDMAEQLFRAGAELKAKETALPHLVVRAVADQMGEEQLPEDLKDKVNNAREAANPKWNPGDLASNLINRYAAG